MYQPAITGTGVFTPSEIITNDELVAAFNAYVERYNAENADKIAAGEVEAKEPSSAEFILAASGIEQRYVLDKTGVLDPAVMHPWLRERADDEPGQMAEMALDACTQALAMAGKTAGDVGAVICAASNHERAYPAIAIEIQNLLGIQGFAFDMNVACSSATFGIQAAADMVKSGSISSALVVNPEICSAHLEWRDRDCHFIFGDVCTAVLIERAEDAKGPHFLIKSTRCATQFSNNIRNNNGYLRRTRKGQMEDRRDMQFMQNGRKVFKEVLPLVSKHIATHMAEENIAAEDLKRLWLHQANKTMNDYIGKKVLGRDPNPGEQPNILQDYANTSSAGSIIAFSKYSNDLQSGDTGLICSFGAGYSVGSVIVERA
ncbi:beta-ketoacyl-ACP synthase III [Roseobacter sp. HKCCD9010]|uniref:beta-ketoacyl-ACP synthase III n=1 Tax=unclassified Roseobacter TaxID=196798 RepID=UPI0014930B6C|nr:MULTISPECIES: beta-ketoacyl-ACP synthase III [unclassified Roseobacter]MBF9051272.1 beta-ketoacyl-ACP synthase III [Rhodobacterales bacterium HKCCD4356]NNV13319.1 beta-ketoacyl-ACP synthase III [Roseobacter sp. HKCCD7357]NNV17570.1 beta-ketoacyl-ACP synthase III [Roseobacter sp. HKCCD8768]NNV27176.1 beta-ketoacyl-ACP synthase III [Roseobacter sp. HKCCD8192]NNV31296.1 beta-ketoacyl-ACP synthase III [Roseobacter sp. HKCCD9061]